MSGSRRALELWPYALITFLYLATWPFHHGLNNPNEMVRVYMTKALVDHKTPVIDRVIAQWGGVDDKAIRDGRLYSSKAPLQSYAGIPGYWLSKIFEPGADKRVVTTWLRRFGSAIPGIVLAWILLAWSRRRAVELGTTERLGTALGLTLALGTMLYPYAITFTGHIWAAATAGGAYLAAIVLERSLPNTPKYDVCALLLGFCAGAAPFAEYPAALMAGPIVLASMVIAPSWRERIKRFWRIAIGGVGPFVFGLWMHAESWGSPFKTGYAFLENKAYVEVHKGGFFGVGAPKLEAFAGSLFSPGTGLLFFSPFLAAGLIALFAVVFRRRPYPEDRALPIGRSLAIAALIGCGLEFLFIAGHTGWRGGWTVGPRYIIPVAPVLGIWAIEALRWFWVRRLLPPLLAASIAITGFSAALYPHLSDVYTNPIASFLVPSYLKGYTTYGIGAWLGLQGHAANLVHVLPLFFAIVYVAIADARGPREVLLPALRSLLIMGLSFAGIALIPERDVSAANNENQRLWGFWEPKNQPRLEPGFVFRARDRWRGARVEAFPPNAPPRGCDFQPGVFDRCFYGPEPWHHFGPDFLDFAGQREPILFLHPIREWVLRATFPLIPEARRAVLRYGLADASVQSDNPTPVRLSVKQRGLEIGRAEAGNTAGLHRLELSLTSTAPISLELECERDGARVFGFDLEVYKE